MKIGGGAGGTRVRVLPLVRSQQRMQAWDDIQRVSSSPTKQPRPESSASHFRVDKWSLYRGTYARLLSIDCTYISGTVIVC